MCLILEILWYIVLNYSACKVLITRSFLHRYGGNQGHRRDDRYNDRRDNRGYDNRNQRGNHHNRRGNYQGGGGGYYGNQGYYWGHVSFPQFFWWLLQSQVHV